MKDRYFGDIYDYVKYSLIRQLADPEGSSTVVCWMLTKDNGGSDGRRTKYLREPEKWSSFEPTIFDFLRRQVMVQKTRNVRAIEKGKILPNCRFYSEILTDDSIQRQRYFDQFLGFSRGAPLVFFDPDNGLEVKSVKHGRRNSSKYLYLSEIERAIRAKHSVLIYQHLPPQPRRPFTGRVVRMLLRTCPSGIVYAIQSRKVAFFLVPQRDSLPRFRKAVSAIERTWAGVLTVSRHRRK